MKAFCVEISSQLCSAVRAKSASQADVVLIMVPADGSFTTAIAKGNHKAGEIQGQISQHSRWIVTLLDTSRNVTTKSPMK